MRKRARRSNSEEEYLETIYADDIADISDVDETNDDAYKVVGTKAFTHLHKYRLFRTSSQAKETN